MSYDFELDSSQYGLCTSPSVYPAAYGWSASVWFRPESLVTDATMLSLCNANDGNSVFYLRIDASNKLQMVRVGPAGNQVIYSSASAIATGGTWYLATYAETSRTSRKIWLNATEITSDATDLLSDWSATDHDLTRIGIACASKRTEDGGPIRYFDGLIAEVAVWTSAILDQTDVTNLYGGGTSGAIASSIKGGPSLWWRLNSDKGSSSYAADTGTGTMTWTNSPVYSATHPSISSGSTIVPKSTRFTMLGIG